MREESTNALLEVHDLGPCAVRPATLAVERILEGWILGDRTDAGPFVEALLSHTVDRPRLSYVEAALLPPATKSSLRAAVATVNQLPPGAAASDDALLDAFRERRVQLARSVIDAVAVPLGLAVVPAAIGEALRGFAEAVHRALGGVDPRQALAALGEGLNAWLERADRHIKAVDEHPCSFILIDMVAGNALVLTELMEEAGPSALARLIKREALDRELLSAGAEAVGRAPSLTDGQREILLKGLEALQQDQPMIAALLLVNGVEGALWSAAVDAGVLVGQEAIVGGRRTYVQGINTLLSDRVDWPIGRRYRRYLRAVVFNADGHALRHGRAATRHEEHAIWAFVALCGWLDRHTDSDLVYAIAERLDTAIDALTPASGAATARRTAR